MSSRSEDLRLASRDGSIDAIQEKKLLTGYQCILYFDIFLAAKQDLFD
jgi:hypothetical protein